MDPAMYVFLFLDPAQASTRKACDAKTDAPTNDAGEKGTLCCKGRVLFLAMVRLHLVRPPQLSILSRSLLKRGRPARHSPQHVK